MKGGRITGIYALALALAVLVQFDRVESWLGSRFEQGLPGWAHELVLGVDALYQRTGLAAAGLELDCATAPLFGGTYKNTYRCAQPALADLDAQAPGGLQAEQACPPALAATQAEPAATANPAAPAPPARPKAAPKLRLPCDVLVVGDSLAIALAGSLERVFKRYDGLNMIPKGKVASGLQNPQYYDWEQALRQFLKEYSPGLVVVMMGANDAKYLSLDPQAPEPCAVADKRRGAYEARLARFLAVLEEKGVTSFWVGLPVMGDQDLSAKSHALNAIVAQACAGTAHSRFLDTWSLLADPGGNYAQHVVDGSGKRVKVREGDKIHFSAAGGDIIAKAFLTDVGSMIELKPKDSKEVAAAHQDQSRATP
ncbi:DUF459 domain-containing protein [Fundidesulfovibrio soli]|uniref:SGNH/GDSL hydrolase family protein n=1 Tax=Fundidesulfovibrio soli TaxID=2922716 RepID=UPI001FAED960|nr:DUF459 domain-containing protein [Fundidesulfovibrio soli]